jgi:hypothetical protein
MPCCGACNLALGENVKALFENEFKDLDVVHPVGFGLLQAKL